MDTEIATVNVSTGVGSLYLLKLSLQLIDLLFGLFINSDLNLLLKLGDFKNYQNLVSAVDVDLDRGTSIFWF